MRPSHLAGFALAPIALGLLACAHPASAQVVITKYGPATDTGSGITFTGPALKTFTEANNFFDTRQNTIDDFNSGTNYSGSEAFGLDIKGSFTIAPGGETFTFRQGSDDGSYSFLTGPGYNNTPLISVPGPTSYSTGNSPKTLNLAAGTYSYDLQYSESNGSPGALRFTSPVPEPSAVASFSLGGLGILGLLLRARRKSAAAA